MNKNRIDNVVALAILIIYTVIVIVIVGWLL